MARQLYTAAFPLIVLTVIPDAEIKTHRRVALLELVQKHIRMRDMLELARDIGLLFERWPLPFTQQKALLLYIAQIGRTSNAAEFIDAVSMPLSEQWGEQMETIAQQLKRMGFEEGIRQGKEKWLAQGIEQGIEQGMKASARQIARQLLLSGMDQQKVRQITQLSDEELAALRRA